MKYVRIRERLRSLHWRLNSVLLVKTKSPTVIHAYYDVNPESAPSTESGL